MTCRILCQTHFDISATGVRSHYKSSRMPFKDDTGNMIIDEASWQRSRNQQRNWETVNQIVALRILPENISMPVCSTVQGVKVWSFEFDVESPEAISIVDRDMGALLTDCHGVPMIIGLEETPTKINWLSTQGPDQNIWFAPISINI